MKKNRILLINLAVLLLYLLIINISTGRGYNAGLEVMVITMIVVFIHAGLNLIASIGSFFARDKSLGLHFLLSTFLVLVVGCAGCFVSSSV